MIINQRYTIDFEPDELQTLLSILLAVKKNFKKPGFVKTLELTENEKEYIINFLEYFTDEADQDS